MPRPTSRYTGVYQRGKSFYYWLDVPVQPGEKRRQISRGGFPTAKAASDAREQHAVELRAGVNTNPSQATVAAYCRAWLDGRTDIPDATWLIYDRIIRKQIEPFAIGGVTLQRLQPQHVATWHRQLLDHVWRTRRDGTQERYSPTTVNQAHAMLTSALKRALAWGMVARNVAALVSPPAIADVEMQTWTPEQLVQFLAVSDEHQHAPFWRLALLTGLRRGELMALKWADIDLDRRTLSVRRTATHTRDERFVIGERAKTRSSVRQISLPPTIVDQLRAHRDRQTFARREAGSRWQEHDLVFTRRDGTMMSPTTIRNHQQRLIRRAGVPPISLHGFRHSAATFALVNNEHFRQVQAMLGHSSAAMTLDRYSHVTEDMRRDYAERIDAAVAALQDTARDSRR